MPMAGTPPVRVMYRQGGTAARRPDPKAGPAATDMGPTPQNRFRFGENWADFSAVIDADRIAAAERSLGVLLARDSLAGLTFLDAGCGSGLFSLAALNLGAKSVTAVDIDEGCVRTTRDLLRRGAKSADWKALRLSVFDLDPAVHGRFDIVYSWGVLHHTGDLRGALLKVAAMADDAGSVALALYRKTFLCRAWRMEKRLYSSSPAFLQRIVRALYKAVFVLGKLARGENPIAHIRNYRSRRGMSWAHDVHDWLGGFPYESIGPDDMAAWAAQAGYEIVASNLRPAGWGLMGTGCDEYVLRRRRPAA